MNTTNTMTAATAYARDTDFELLAQVLRPYLPHCRYLRTAPVRLIDSALTVSGAFEISDSCYIDDTGHFNAVEFNICYNQLSYYLIAKSIADGLLPVFDGWTLDDFWRLQRPSILITDFRSTFRNEMRGKKFNGSVTLTGAHALPKTKRWDPLIALHTTCRFWDADGGTCWGGARLAITDPIVTKEAP